MSTDSTTVGRCPQCQSTIEPWAVIIRYERADDEAMYATCGECGDVVRPQSSG